MVFQRVGGQGPEGQRTLFVPAAWRQARGWGVRAAKTSPAASGQPSPGGSIRWHPPLPLLALSSPVRRVVRLRGGGSHSWPVGVHVQRPAARPHRPPALTVSGPAAPLGSLRLLNRLRPRDDRRHWLHGVTCNPPGASVPTPRGALRLRPPPCACLCLLPRHRTHDDRRHWLERGHGHPLPTLRRAPARGLPGPLTSSLPTLQPVGATRGPAWSRYA